MAFLPSNQRDQLMVLLSLCGVLAVGAYWMYYLDPRSQELVAVEEHVETLTLQNERAKAELARNDPDKLRRDALEYRRNLDAMRQLVPTSNEVPALLEQVSTAARRVGLDLGGVEPEPVIPGDQFDTYRYRISLEGDYHAVGAFLANVGSLTRIVAPVNVQLKPSTSGAALKPGEPVPARQPLVTHFQIQTYVARTAAPAAKSAAPESEQAQSETP
ncbi:MAG TPA: type 4a pilus biogenesis protein PilO [Gemmatimonadaceae bacterium]|nr:type 4a pilus biogenesis protein PilO [Gemmatimonadaceae bacterium]